MAEGAFGLSSGLSRRWIFGFDDEMIALASLRHGTAAFI